jgi:hypothetical protein
MKIIQLTLIIYLLNLSCAFSDEEDFSAVNEVLSILQNPDTFQNNLNITNKCQEGGQSNDGLLRDCVMQLCSEEHRKYNYHKITNQNIDSILSSVDESILKTYEGLSGDIATLVNSELAKYQYLIEKSKEQGIETTNAVNGLKILKNNKELMIDFEKKSCGIELLETASLNKHIAEKFIINVKKWHQQLLSGNPLFSKETVQDLTKWIDDVAIKPAIKTKEPETISVKEVLEGKLKAKDSHKYKNFTKDQLKDYMNFLAELDADYKSTKSKSEDNNNEHKKNFFDLYGNRRYENPEYVGFRKICDPDLDLTLKLNDHSGIWLVPNDYSNVDYQLGFSSLSCLHDVYGSETTAHELGHLYDFYLTKAKNASVESKKKISKTKRCLKRNSSKNYVSEDFADLFAGLVNPNEPSSLFCSFASYAEDLKNESNSLEDYPILFDKHLTKHSKHPPTYIRMIRVRMQKDEAFKIPQSCLEYHKNSENGRRFKLESCL